MNLAWKKKKNVSVLLKKCEKSLLFYDDSNAKLFVAYSKALVGVKAA